MGRNNYLNFHKMWYMLSNGFYNCDVNKHGKPGICKRRMYTSAYWVYLKIQWLFYKFLQVLSLRCFFACSNFYNFIPRLALTTIHYNQQINFHLDQGRNYLRNMRVKVKYPYSLTWFRFLTLLSIRSYLVFVSQYKRHLFQEVKDSSLQI